MDKVKLYFHKLNKYEELESFKANYAQSDEASLHFSEDFSQIKEINWANEVPSVLLFAIAGKEDLKDLVSLLKSHVNLVKSGSLKCVGFFFKKNPKVEKILRKFGCTDYVLNDISAKALSFKFDFWIKSAKTHFNKQVEVKETKKEKKAISITSKKDDEFKMLAPLEISSDIWLLENKNNCRKVLGKWLITLNGPSARVAKWNEIPNRPREWVLHWDNEEYQHRFVSSGTWVFEGNKPEYDWKLKRWVFSAKTPALYFEEGTSRFFKIASKVNMLSICSDSKVAEGKRQLYEESASTDFSIDGDKKEKAKEAKNIEQDSHISTKMEGKTSTDEISMYMEGEDKSEKTHEDSHYEGSLKQSANNEDTEKDNKSFSSELPSGELGGKGKTDHLDYSQLEEKRKEKQAQELAQKEKELSDTLAEEQSFDFVDKKEEAKEDDRSFEEKLTESGETVLRVEALDDKVVYLCRMEDFFDSELTFSTKEVLPKKEQYRVTLSYEYAGSKVTIKKIATVLEYDEEQITVRLEGLKEEESEKIISMFEERQSKIFEFMSLAKGF